VGPGLPQKLLPAEVQGLLLITINSNNSSFVFASCLFLCILNPHRSIAQLITDANKQHKAERISRYLTTDFIKKEEFGREGVNM
jgi:hypothetical protein